MNCKFKPTHLKSENNKKKKHRKTFHDARIAVQKEYFSSKSNFEVNLFSLLRRLFSVRKTFVSINNKM